MANGCEDKFLDTKKKRKNTKITFMLMHVEGDYERSMIAFDNHAKMEL